MRVADIDTLDIGAPTAPIRAGEFQRVTVRADRNVSRVFREMAEIEVDTSKFRIVAPVRVLRNLSKSRCRKVVSHEKCQ
ncbi:hypothetical protein IH86_20860 [Sphingobium yanoikuyae]|nr:hypothetical protein IH86_20860 [Sphingobium yanoikuyae]